MLNRLFLLCCFFPFVSPYPIGSDIQPLAGILAAVIVIRLAVISKKIDKNLLVILSIPFFLLAYNNFLSGDFNFDIGKALSLSFGALILVGFYHSKKYLSIKFFVFVVTFYFAFTILLLLFTAPMIQIQNLVIRVTNSTDFSYRGVAALVTEPGLFGGLLIFFFIINDYLYENKGMKKTHKYAVDLMLLFMLIMTKSGTGYLYFVLYLMLKYLFGNHNYKNKLKVLIISMLALPVLFFFFASLESSSLGRGAAILMQLSDLDTLIYSDMSVLTRVVNVWLGLVAIFYYPLGVGNTAVLDVAYELMLETPFVRNFYQITDRDFGINSSFTYLTFSYGVIFWAYLISLLSYFSKSDFIWKFFSMLYLCVSYSAAFPAIWILLALKMRKDKK